jgi:hypothetical protein
MARKTQPAQRPGKQGSVRTRPAAQRRAAKRVTARPKAAASGRKRGGRAAGASGTAPKVRVRMYRQGLGDCFLITFDVGGSEKHMLIDCGTLGATTTGVTLAKVVQDIQTTTKKHLHLLIATHEHWDHVAAFDHLQNQFKAMTIDNVWMAWTEDPADVLAQKIRKTKEDLGAALAEASRAMTSPAASPESVARGEAVASILGFFDDSSLGAGKFSQTVDDAMEFVRTGIGTKARYCNPGDGPLEETWLPGFRFFVLGPPRDEKALYNLGEHGSSELYSLAAGLKAAAQLFDSGKAPSTYVQGSTVGEQSDFASALPFDVRFRRESSAESTKEMFAKTYLAEKAGWRKVDEDWMHVASDFALQLDSATNNTSLALAIERIADGKVLLFPADAQQGNWVSWHDPAIQWTVKDGSTSRNVKAANLLSRTVFYKVGHHSSHNATARAKGLELMDQTKELTAFIPVDRAVALKRNPKGSWKMPALTLYRRLLEKCEGRVARSDIGWAADATTAKDATTEKEFVGMATAGEWTTWTKAQRAATHVAIASLYIDYLLE